MNTQRKALATVAGICTIIPWSSIWHLLSVAVHGEMSGLSLAIQLVLLGFQISCLIIFVLLI